MHKLFYQCNKIVDGEMDEYPEAAFLMVGTIEEVKQKAESIKAAME